MCLVSNAYAIRRRIALCPLADYPHEDMSTIRFRTVLIRIAPLSVSVYTRSL